VSRRVDRLTPRPGDRLNRHRSSRSAPGRMGHAEWAGHRFSMPGHAAGSVQRSGEALGGLRNTPDPAASAALW